MRNFEVVFNQALDELEEEAKLVGLTMTSICRTVDISRATPDRWRRKPPLTIRLIREMQQVVEKRKIEIAKSIPGEIK